MKKQLWIGLSVMLLAALLLGACGPKAQPATLTIWHAYHTGEAEEQTLTQVVDAYKAAHPEVTVNVLAVPFDQIFNKWETEVAAGGGPDMFTAPNDNLGNEIRGGLVAPIDELVAGKLDGFTQLGIDGVSYEGKIYAVPGIAKAVGLFYNKSTIATPPTTMDELMALVKDGKTVILRPYGYHLFGIFTGAFGGTLLDETGKCVADQGGFTEAFTFLAELQAAGALFEPDEGKANTMFMQGEADMILTGPWMLGTFKEALGDNLGAIPLPAGPGGTATPLTGIDGWYINPNSANQQAAVDLALYIFGPEGAKVYSDVAGDPMARTDVTASDPLVAEFAAIAAAGFPRPQSVEFGAWWGAFDDASKKLLENQGTPEELVAAACATMNTANNK
jgi:arabinogalactan oligomer/maltooligosaccharide transport system substrate-binding protein